MHIRASAQPARQPCNGTTEDAQLRAGKHRWETTATCRHCAANRKLPTASAHTQPVPPKTCSCKTCNHRGGYKRACIHEPKTRDPEHTDLQFTPFNCNATATPLLPKTEHGPANPSATANHNHSSAQHKYKHKSTRSCGSHNTQQSGTKRHPGSLTAASRTRAPSRTHKHAKPQQPDSPERKPTGLATHTGVRAQAGLQLTR